MCRIKMRYAYTVHEKEIYRLKLLSLTMDFAVSTLDQLHTRLYNYTLLSDAYICVLPNYCYCPVINSVYDVYTSMYKLSSKNEKKTFAI
jgi:cellulose synthase/poly-beta-1,6-N-acetylglucosamine synthase-like glycosyltransferase